MMDDLISRQAAIDVLSKWLHDVIGIKESDGTTTIFKRLRELPSAQPEPERKRGRWIQHYVGQEHIPWGSDCSVCGEWLVIDRLVMN